MNGGQELPGVAAWEVRAAYRAGKESVSGKKQSVCREVEAYAAFGVAGCMKDGAGQPGDGDELAVFEGVVRVFDLGGRDAEPGRLDVHHLDER